MASIYSTLIAHFSHASGDSAALSPPAGYIWVVRDISVYNGNLLEDVQASVTGIDATTLWMHEWLTAGGWAHDEGRWVIPAEAEGGFLQCHATFPCDFYISGYALSTP
jgi:hypothetical protein